MMQVQITILVPGNNQNRIIVDLLAREDANDTEREMALNIQELMRGVMETIRDELPDGEVEIEVIE